MFHKKEEETSYGVRPPSREKAGYRPHLPLQALLALADAPVAKDGKQIEIRPPKGDPGSYDRIH